MNAHAHRPYRGPNPWRIAGWTMAALLLLLPLVAMQFTDEVNWSPADFVFAAALLAGVGIPLELAVRKSGNAAYRAATGVALAATLLLVWVNAAVGIVGSENNDVNLLYYGVVVIGVVGAFLVNARAEGMARTLAVAALAQAIITAIAMLTGASEAEGGITDAMRILLLNGFFIALFLGSALLFRAAARGPDHALRAE